MKNFLKNPCLIYCLLMLAPGFANASTPVQVQPLREYQLKAVFLFNFTRFVEWPPKAFPQTTSPIVIGLLNGDELAPFLEEAIRNESSSGHPLVLRRFGKVEDVDACHLLFVHSSDKSGLNPVFGKAESMGILTVGDAAGFAEQGGMIELVTESGKTRIRINLKAARAAGLTISSKLLGLAEIVSPDDN